MYKRILVPLDGSSLAEAVLPHAISLAQTSGAEIILVRVTLNPAAEFSFSDPSIASSIIEESDFETKRYLNTLSAKLESAGLRVSFLIRQGPIAETILEVADAMQVDLIAMSTHGRSGIQRWLMGSVADRVVRHSQLPVMLIRPQKSDAK